MEFSSLGSRPHPVSVPGNLWPPPVLTEGSCSPLLRLLSEHTGIPVLQLSQGRPACNASLLQPGEESSDLSSSWLAPCLNSVWMEEMEPQVSSPLNEAGLFSLGCQFLMYSLHHKNPTGASEGAAPFNFQQYRN